MLVLARQSCCKATLCGVCERTALYSRCMRACVLARHANQCRNSQQGRLDRYFGLGSAWAYYIYYAFGQQLFPSGNKPAWNDLLEQIKVSRAAFACALPPGRALVPDKPAGCQMPGWVPPLPLSDLHLLSTDELLRCPLSSV